MEVAFQRLNPFRLAPAAWLLAVLVTFILSLTQPSDAAPQLDPNTQGNAQMPIRLCVLHNFGAKKGEPVGPAAPGTLTQGAPGDDNFYGTTQTGGANGQGAVFKLTPDGEIKILYSFDGKHLGGQPRGGVSLGPGDYLYGTTLGGGDFAAGTIFKLPTSGGEPTQVYEFGAGKIFPPIPYPKQPTKQQVMDAAGGYPSTAPVQGTDGYFYGITPAAANGSGSLYQFDSTTSAFRCLYIFSSKDGATYGLQPNSLTRGTGNIFYGTTWNGGLGFGTVFKFDPAQKYGPTGGITTLYRFVNNNTQHDGSQANGVIQGADGNLYGTTYAGGPQARGVVFRLSPSAGGKYTVLHYFGGNASNPSASLVEVLQNDVLASDSTAPPTKTYYLYGACAMCGSADTREDTGTLFRIREDGTNFSDVYNFDGTTGVDPQFTPVLARDSNLYGATAGGGSAVQGVFYRLNTAYFVTGEAETDSTTDPKNPHVKLVFQGNQDGKTFIYPGAVPQAAIRVSTHMAGFQPGGKEASWNKTNDGITVRVTDPTAKIVQFYYRMRLNSKGQPISGVVDQYDPTISYPAGADVRFAGQVWLSTVEKNIGHQPPASACTPLGATCHDDFWILAAIVDGKPQALCPKYMITKCDTAPPCSGSVGIGCDVLSTNAMAPNWIVDAQYHKPDAYYVAIDTQIDCDGFTLFDSPTLQSWDTDEDQIFGAMDYIILHGVVIATVRWTYEKQFTADPQYTVSVTGPLVATIAAMQKLTLAQGFNVAFAPPKP